MSDKFDREALALLRALLRVAVLSLTSGLHHLPPEIASSKAAGDSLRALRAAFEALRDDDRAASLERRGAPMADADNVIRLPTNAGHALASDEQRDKAERVRAAAIWREADRVDAAIHFIEANWSKTAKPVAAFRRLIDACHEVQKLCANEFDANLENQVLAEYWEARLALAGAGVGDEEIDAAFQCVIAEREARCPAGTRAAHMAYLMRTLVGAPCPAIVASGTLWRLPLRARRSPRRKAAAGARSR